MGVADDLHTIEFQVVNITTTYAIVVVKGELPKAMRKKLTSYRSEHGVVKLKAIGDKYRVFEVAADSEFSLAKIVMFFDVVLTTEGVYGI